MHNNMNINVGGVSNMEPCTYKSVILKKNIVNNDNVLTQSMINENGKNTKFIIKWNFTIGGSVNGTANVDAVSPFPNPGFALAHEAWIAADNAYTNNPNDETLAAKNTAYAALQANPQYWNYDSKQVVVKAYQQVRIPEGCVLLNSNGAIVEFDNGVANRDIAVFIASLVQGEYNYTISNAIVMPSDCLIEFDGGSISDGVLVGNDTILIYNQPLNKILTATLEGTWRHESGVKADEEDITDINGELKLKDREPASETNPNGGMGSIILRKDKTFEEQLTQENTFYEIRYDFELTGDVTVPANCVLQFEGGSLSNGSLIGQNTYIVGNLLNILSNNISLVGDWKFKSISPDWFIGTDVEKLQKAFDVSIALRYVEIVISRSYDITGGTILIDKGLHYEDEVSLYGRKNLVIQGKGEARICKRDAGYMFSANDFSVDYLFKNIFFEGYSASEPEDCVEMIVFNCNYLGCLYTEGCVFNWCGCVYFQDGANTFMQGVYSTNNLYAKNKCVFKARKSFDTRFFGDEVESGYIGFEGYSDGVNMEFRIQNCCIEGFFKEGTKVINFDNPCFAFTINNNYFEANYCTIHATHSFSTVEIKGNSFHARGNRIPAETELNCIELASLTNYTITDNVIVPEDSHMTLFYFDTDSPHYIASALLIGTNTVYYSTNISNVPAKIWHTNIEVQKQNKVFTYSYVNDIINAAKTTYGSSVIDGHIYVQRRGDIISISVNIETTTTITSGGINSYTTEITPLMNGIISSGGMVQAIVDKDNNLMGELIVNESGTLYIKVPQAGHYKGTLCYPCKRL